MKKIFIAAGAVLAVLAGFYFFNSSEQKQELLTSVVKRGDLSKEVEAVGEVFALNLVDVGAQTGGQIKQIHVKVGDVVSKGDKIADIDAITQQNKLDQAVAELETLNAKLNSAKIAHKIAQTQYEREKKLFEANASSKESLENFENSAWLAMANLKELESKIKQENIAIDTARANLSYANIVAPIDGTIVSLPISVGQTLNVNQSTPLVANIANLNQMQIKMKISEADVVNVKVGDKVEYSVLGDTSKKYYGVIDSIDPGLTTLSDGTYASKSSTSAAIYYYAKLKVNNESGFLRIGMTTQNSIITQEIKGALSVPTIAIKMDEGGYYVLIKQGEQIAKFNVEIGISTGVDTQIISGLEEGQIVVVSQLGGDEIEKMLKNQKVRMRL